MAYEGFQFEQHPVPQQISSYQFRLVGDMTLKQFFELAGGALISVLFYASPLPGIFKWPLIVISVLFGAALAFLPIQDRPLERWVAAFLRSVYSPTLYVWKRTNPNIYYMKAQAATTTAQKTDTSSLPKFLKGLEEAEESVLGKIQEITGSRQQAVGNKPVMPAPPQVQYGGRPVVVEIPKTTPQTVYVGGPAHNAVPSEAGEQVGKQVTPQTVTIFADQPNILVGQVIDTEGKIIESVILEIRDLQGRPVRALRSNKAGQFRIVTPLGNGKYRILAEKEGYNFDTLEVEMAGNIVQPIVIKAR